ncbi:MAG: hypothetical protein HY805_09660 [Nitrospirae bacterium]|nr:hypothetical protein [Nitrospirota bacterium]
MLSREELKDISKIHGNGSYFVSLYLNVDPVTNPRGEYMVRFKNMMKDTIESMDKTVLRKVKADLDAIDAYIFGNRRDFKKGLSILSSAENSFWRRYDVSVPLKSELIVDKLPYIKPLLDIVDNYQRYAVLLVDKESARIFVMHLGEIIEFGEVHTADVPGKHKKGGWFALSQNHYERHIAYHVGMHLKDVIKRLDSFIKRQYIGRVIIAGGEEAVSMTKALLPKTVTDRIIGSFQAGMFEGNTDILKKVEPVQEAFERQKETDTVNELIQRARKNEKAVLGIDDVLNAVQEGRVMKLVFLRDFKYQGYSCVSCRALSAQGLRSCPYCKGKMEDVGYLVDLIAQKAVEQGSIIEVVTASAELKEAGSIGAFLRF